jgi:pyruvate/2-oxoglutarate/acetoin dehydrogenase E1 component
MSKYFQGLTDAMTMLAANPKAVFVGQGVAYPGQAMFRTLEGVPMHQRIEFPVAEDLQMGYCTGLAMAGFLPVCIYPRIDFLLLALNQLVNHLDKWPALTGTTPRVIIRTAIGGKKPFYAGVQHTQDHVQAISLMLRAVHIEKIDGDPLLAYQHALKCELPSIIVEESERYYE